jgi:hypothetical protein
MAALLTSEELTVLVLLDDDRAGRDTQADLVRSKVVRDTAVMFVTEAFVAPKPAEADIEDLIDPTIYAKLINHTYAKELSGKTLTLNPSIPRIVKRYEDAFAVIGLEFHKTRPAREFMVRMGTDPDSVLNADSAAKFGTLLRAVRERYERIRAAGRGAFN